MVSEQKVNQTDPVNDANLISFDSDIDKQAQPRDINKKITSLEEGLVQLNSELKAINASVEEGLDRLSDNDTDLTAKVSETYKRLGEIDKAYRSLMDISMKLDTDILKISQNVDEVAEQSLNGLKNLEENTIEKNNELAERNQQVAARVSALAEQSLTTNELLNDSIRKNTDALLGVEKKLIEEIETLAETTREHNSNVDRELEAGKARVVKLQQVDEAIIRRATSLEITADELMQKTSDMSVSIRQLDEQATDLTGKVVDLIIHTQKLQDEQNHHTGLIEGLQNNFIDMTQSVLSLTETEKKHFRIMSAAFLFVMVVIAGLYFYQDAALQKKAAEYAATDTEIKHAVSDLYAQDISSTKYIDAVDGQVKAVGDNLVAVNRNLGQELKLLNRKLVSVTDKVQTIDGRLNTSMMIDTIGSDNVIHGKQWLADQPLDNYIIKLATVTDKNALYEIAQRYNYYLTDKLSYTATESNQQSVYTLLYGNYTSQKKAIEALQKMPRYIDWQRPDLKKIKDVIKM